MIPTPERRWTMRLLALASVTVLSACAAATTSRIPPERGLVVTNPQAAREMGVPRVSVSTEYEYSAFRRVRTRVKLEEDAYVLVVNVAPDGAARVIFPETPADPGLLKGGKSYLLPVFFGGYPSMALETQTVGTRFGIVRQSALASPTLRGPGYTVVLASRTPFDMQHLEDEGLFDWVELGSSTYELDPDAVIPMLADMALPAGVPFIVSADYARYAGYDPLAGSRMAFAYARGDAANCRYGSWDAPFYGFGTFMSSRGPLDCIGLAPQYRPYVPVVVPPAKPDTTGSDTTSTPAEGEHPLTRRPPGTNRFRTPETSAQADRDVELTTESRRRMLRDGEYTRRMRRDGAIEPGRSLVRDFDRSRTTGTGADVPRRRVRTEADGGGSRGTIDRGASPSRREPARTEPSRREPSPRQVERSTPSRSPEPVRTEPTRSEPARTQPTRSEPVRTEPSRTTEPMRSPRQR